MTENEKYLFCLDYIKKYEEIHNIKKLIRNEKYTKQLISFEGLNVGDMYPTDIDGALEYDDIHLILFEVKHNNKEIPLGQKKLLYRLADSWVESGLYTGIEKKSIVFKVSHNTPPDETIKLVNGMVFEYYYNGKWLKKDKPVTTLKAVYDIAKEWEIDKLKSWYLFNTI
jgi:hypothetical protein